VHHLDTAHDAHAADDPQGVRGAHASLRRCLRTARQCFRDIALEALQADSDKTKLVQTSAGTGPSTGSDGGRASPLLKGDIPGWLDRARVGGRR
jgi:hypothetical protein